MTYLPWISANKFYIKVREHWTNGSFPRFVLSNFKNPKSQVQIYLLNTYDPVKPMALVINQETWLKQCSRIIMTVLSFKTMSFIKTKLLYQKERNDETWYSILFVLKRAEILASFRSGHIFVYNSSFVVKNSLL